MKRIYYLLVGILFMTACSSEDTFTDGGSTSQSRNTQLDEKTILAYTNNFSNSFVTNTRGVDTITYPDYYGGLYVDDNRNIVILVKGDNVSIKRDLTERMRSDLYTVKSCDYSYNELQSVFKKLTEFWLNSSNDTSCNAVSLISFGVNESTNRVQVDLLDCSTANVLKFKQSIMDSPILSFEKAHDKIRITADITPGNKLENARGAAGSTGYRAMKSGVEGFLTAGHFVNVGDIVKINGIEVGKCEASQFSGNLDAAWCKATNGYKPSYKTSMGVDLSRQTIATPSVGIYVNMEGFMSNLQRDKVLQTGINAVYTYNDANGVEQTTKVTNVVKANYKCQKGDSGGVVYTDDGSLAGIQSGGSDKITATQFSVSYFALAKYIQTTLGVYLY